MPSYRLDDWRGGWQTFRGTNINLGPSTLIDLQNMEYFIVPDAEKGYRVVLRGRRGRSAFTASAIVSGGQTTDLFRYYPKSASPATVAIVQDVVGTPTKKNFYHDTDDNGTFASITGDFNANATASWYGVIWPEKDKLFLANGSNGLYSYNGATLAAVSQSAIQMQGPYITVYQSHLIGTRPDTLEREVYFSAADDELTVSGSLALSLNDPQGGLITGLWSLQDRLLISKQTSWWYQLGSPLLQGALVRYSDVGNVAPRAACQTPWGIIYVAREGVKVTDGVSQLPIDVTGPLLAARFSTASTDSVFPSAVAVYYPRLQQYWLKLAPADTQVYVLSRLEGPDNSVALLWATYTSMPLVAGLSWSGESDDGRLLLASSDGKLWRADNTTLDDASEITAVAQTAFQPTAFPDRVGRIHQIKASYQGKGQITAGIRYDANTSNDTAVTLGSSLGAAALQRPRGLVTTFDKSGEYWSLRLSHAAANPTFELHSLEVLIRPRSGRLWR